MKKDIKEVTTENQDKNSGQKITRKEAIKKAGYIAVSAATMMILLSSPNKAQAGTASPAPVGPWQP